MPGGKERGSIARSVACGHVLDELRERGWASVPLDPETHAAYLRLAAHANWFFDEPTEHKQALDITNSVGHRGWVSPDQAGDYEDEGPRRYEAFDIGRTPAATDLVEHALRGHNRWPRSAEGAAMRRDAETMFEFLESTCELIGDAICADLLYEPGIQLLNCEMSA